MMNRARVLVVDDEPINLEIIAELLDGPRFELDLMPDADSALARLEDVSRRYDLIILDRMMPGMSGLEMLRRLKADQRFRSIPVIMQTAAATPEQVREGMEAGAYYYLTKPYEPGALLVIVAAVLDDAEQQARLMDTLEQSQRQLNALQLMTQAAFRFSKLEEVSSLASLLAGICPSPDVVVLGLNELMMNAVEHGSLGISYSEKMQLKRSGSWSNEVARRSGQPEYSGRSVQLCMERDSVACEIRFTITDQGEGFEWRKFLEFDPTRAFDPNGRGIAMARQISFSRLEYQGCGNVVVASVNCHA